MNFKKSKIILFMSILLAMLAYGMTLPLFPFIIDSLGGRGLHLGLLVATYGIMQLIFASLWGRVSDKRGRKPIILLGMIGLVTSMTFFYFSKNLTQLYFAQAILGAFTSAIFPVSMAYLSDITKQEERASAIGKIGAATGLGIVLGPGIGGLLAFESLFFPFALAGTLSIITIIFILIFLPESLKNKNKERRKNKLFDFKIIFNSLKTTIGFGLIIVFAVNFGKSNFSSIFGLYAIEQFNYGTKEIGIILMIVGIIYALVQGLFVGFLTKRYGEIKVMKFSLLGNALGFIFLLFANNFLTLIISISFLIIFNALLKPTSLSYISLKSHENQGAVMGIADAYMSIGRIIGPLWAGFIFDINIYFPFISGTIFFIIIYLIANKILNNTSIIRNS